MADPAHALKELKREREFLIGIDSDGCAFDTMEIKHKECFIPNIIKYWNLQAVSKYAREAVRSRGFKLPEITFLRNWVETETKLGNPALEKKVYETGDPILKITLEWTMAINETIAELVHGVPPYPYVRESLAKVQADAQVIIVSQTPNEALEREWTEHNLVQYVKVIVMG